ncbi:MAG: M12 family metallo-peptidase [Rubrivivax sp.]|nr:M12 family metallo-peptidase [Rubrivivax sp.]
MKKFRSSAVPLGALVSLVMVTAGASVAMAAPAQGRKAAPAAAVQNAAAHPSRAFWLEQRGTPAATSARGTPRAVPATRLRAVTLDKLSLTGLLQAAPAERSAAARQNPLVFVLPDPAGGFQRFAVVDSPIMEPGLAARHPDVKTYAGRGIDDPTATLRMSVTPLGLQASVRAASGAWYVEPYYERDQSLYASYLRADVPRRRTSFAEGLLTQAQVSLSRGRYRAADAVQVQGLGFVPNATLTITVRQGGDDVVRQTLHATASEDGTLSVSFPADPYRATGKYEVTVSDGRSTSTSAYQVVADGATLDASVGGLLRTYRLALLTDPAYANYFGGSATVTAAKVALVNRVTHVYEDETSIRLVLIANNDALNLDTAAQFSTANGPCGGTACFPTASVSCSSATLTRNRLVIGLLAGASNYDIGHIAVGAGGGGIASLGVVGGNNKAQGCTGLPTPAGDLFAVDYVAHEMGHQFAGNHTFNGTVGSCSGGNRSAANSVEPGSGSSIMAYAGICGTDNLQPNSDPYWSQRSFDEVVTFISAAETSINETQYGVLTGFNTNGQQFQLRYNGNDSAPLVRGTNYTTAGIKAAVEAIPGWPAGATVTASTVGDTAFTLTFGGALASTDAALLQLVGCTAGCTGFVGEVAKGGLTTRGGNTQTATGNQPPAVAALTQFTIPLRTPFALTGSATDPDGDTVTYMWEQTDRGAATGTSLISNVKLNGPLFRQFGTRQVVASALVFAPPGQNAATTNPTRVFPDLSQLLDNNTNAETGACPTVAGSPTAAQTDCYSEFLPTADYVGFTGVNASPARLNFKLTARDGRGGVNSATTVLTLAPATGPFLVTAPNTADVLEGGMPTTVTWNVAGTDAAPIGTANVRIMLSVDGGLSYPYTLAAQTPNDGSQAVTLPIVATAAARVKVEALGNVFFDVSNASFPMVLLADLNSDGLVDCADIAIVQAALGTRVGDAGFDPRADVNNDGLIDVRDLAFVTRRVTTGSRCR